MKTSLLMLALAGSFLSGSLVGGMYENQKHPDYISVSNFVDELTTDSVHPMPLWGYKANGVPVLGFTPIDERKPITLTGTGSSGASYPLSATQLHIPQYKRK